MLRQFLDLLATWGVLDTWIVVTATLSAMACALPGNFLLLRRQSMMGDALSHTTLPGIAIAFLITHGLRTAGIIPPATYDAFWITAVFLGAIVLGVLTTLATELIHSLGRLEPSATLGVVFTVLFALGLLLIRLAADKIDLDPDCVLYGTIETAATTLLPGEVPRAAISNGLMLAVNLTLVVIFFKELRLAAFDPELATSLGFNARFIHLALMAATAATVVAAFESVGSILVVAMLIVPPATARLLCDRLGPMIVVSLVVAAASALLGHVMAITVPPLIFTRLGYPQVGSAYTAGSMAVAAGLIFATMLLIAPRQGLLSRIVWRLWLGVKIASEDWLGVLYRREELRHVGGYDATGALVGRARGFGPLLTRLALARLRWQGKVAAAGGDYVLTEQGRHEGKQLVRGHRLWETYLARHFPETAVHLHESAHRAEHFVTPAMQAQLAAELDRPETDPQGKVIPPAG